MATTTQEVKAPPQHKEVEHFSDAERAAWLKDGTMPLLEEKEIMPANEGASATPKPGASDSGKKAESGTADERPHEKRIKELSAREKQATERAEAAERELEEFRTGKKKPEEKKVDAAPKLLEMPVRPKMKDFMGENNALDSDKYEAALDKYETDKSAYINEQTQIRTAAAQQEQSITTWKTELKAKYGEKSDGIDVKKTVDSLASTLREAPAFFMFLNDSEVFTDLLFVLGTDPKLDELLAEAKDPKTVTRAIRKLVALEAGVKVELAKQAAGGKKENEEESGEKRPLTKAGKPITESSGSSSSPTDDGSSAAAWNRKDLSVSERGELYRERKNKEEREKRKKKVN